MTVDSEKQTHLLSPAGELADACATRAAARVYTFETAKAWVGGEEFAGQDGLR